MSTTTTKLQEEFDGKAVAYTRMSVSGLSAAMECDEEVLRIDDSVRLVMEGVVTGVNFVVNKKTGDLERVQTIKATTVGFTPWDPNDPLDKGIIRSVPQP